MPTLVHVCDECDSEFQLRYEIEKCESDPTYCPFCSAYILEKDDEYVDED